MSKRTYECAVSGCSGRAERKYCPVHSPGRSSNMHRALCSVRARAKRAGVNFDLTPEYFIDLWNNSTHCPVFGVEYEVRKDSGPGNWSKTLDRIEPDKGYVQGNVQFMSMLANHMKSNATPDQLRLFAEWVLRHPSFHKEN